jgi:hypothetical protein
VGTGFPKRSCSNKRVGRGASRNHPRTAAIAPRFGQTITPPSGKLTARKWEAQMYSSQSPELAPAGGPPRDLDADARSDQRIRPMRPPIHPARSFGRAAIERPSIGKRILRTVIRFSVAVLIGIGGTLAWQAYGDEAKEMLVTRAPALGWWLSVSRTKPATAAAATSPDLSQQLAPLALNLDAVRRSVEQLAAKQEQLTQNVATLRAVEQDIRERISAPPPQQAASSPQPKPPQPRAPSPAAQASTASASAPPPRPSRSPLRLLDSPAPAEQ